MIFSTRANYYPKISIVVPAYNASKTIDRCIQSLLKQNYKNYEIIIVDDSSTDNTSELVKKYPVKLLKTPKNTGAGGARNIGIESSRGEIIAFTDSDCIALETWLQEIVNTFIKLPEASAIGGGVLNVNVDIISWADYFSNFSEFIPTGTIREMRTIPTLNIAYKMEKLNGLRFLNLSNTEDTILNMQFREKGNKIFFNPNLLIKHNHRRVDLKSYLLKQKFYGKWFVYSRIHYNLPGKKLIKYKYLFLLFPRIILIIKRIIKTKYIIKFIKILPIIFLGEISRTKAIFCNSKSNIET